MKMKGKKRNESWYVKTMNDQNFVLGCPLKSSSFEKKKLWPHFSKPDVKCSNNVSGHCIWLGRISSLTKTFN